MNDEWLNEMLDAALGDENEPAAAPDFQAIRTLSRRRRRPRIIRYSFPSDRRRTLLAAAALLIGIAVSPFLVTAGRNARIRATSRAMDDVFVNGLLGESLFDEGLTVDGSPVIGEGLLFSTVSDIDLSDI